MAGRKYKEISFRDGGADCDFRVRAETEEEILRIVADHACHAHKMCEFTPELKSKVLANLKTGSL